MSIYPSDSVTETLISAIIALGAPTPVSYGLGELLRDFDDALEGFAGGGYASLTGTGKLNPTGDLTQAGDFSVDGALISDGLLNVANSLAYTDILLSTSSTIVGGQWDMPNGPTFYVAESGQSITNALLPIPETGAYLWLINNTGTTITVTPSSGTINGQATVTLAASQGTEFWYDGTLFWQFGVGGFSNDSQSEDFVREQTDQMNDPQTSKNMNGQVLFNWPQSGALCGPRTIFSPTSAYSVTLAAQTTVAPMDPTNLNVSCTAVTTSILVDVDIPLIGFFGSAVIDQGLVLTLVNHNTSTQIAEWVGAYQMPVAGSGTNSYVSALRRQILVEGLTLGHVYEWDLAWASSATTGVMLTTGQHSTSTLQVGSYYLTPTVP